MTTIGELDAQEAELQRRLDEAASAVRADVAKLTLDPGPVPMSSRLLRSRSSSRFASARALRHRVQGHRGTAVRVVKQQKPVPKKHPRYLQIPPKRPRSGAKLGSILYRTKAIVGRRENCTMPSEANEAA